MTPVSPRPSYRDLPPLERGGEINRNGLEFQDHVAAGYCIDMLSGSSLVEVWCETLDDITLVWCKDDCEEFEFVQAKSNSLNHLWSVAELCKRDKKKGKPSLGSSIFEKLIANERGKEKSYFRIVTTFPVNQDLKILKFPLHSPHRNPTNHIKDFDNLCKAISDKLLDCQFPCDNGDPSIFLNRMVWDVRHSEEAVENTNIRKLTNCGMALSIFLAPDQWEEIYRKILRKVQDAGKEKWDILPEGKKIKRDEFKSWFEKLIESVQHPGAIGKGDKLRIKMESANISPDSIKTANELRRFYRSKTLAPGYMNLSKRQEIEMEVSADLNYLKSQLDSGHLDETGVDFHARCLFSLDKIQQAYPQEITFPLLQGYMYNLTDRCLHRFTRVAS